jgi:hypothetical protein
MRIRSGERPDGRGPRRVIQTPRVTFCMEHYFERYVAASEWLHGPRLRGPVMRVSALMFARVSHLGPWAVESLSADLHRHALEDTITVTAAIECVPMEVGT